MINNNNNKMIEFKEKQDMLTVLKCLVLSLDEFNKELINIKLFVDQNENKEGNDREPFLTALNTLRQSYFDKKIEIESVEKSIELFKNNIDNF